MKKTNALYSIINFTSIIAVIIVNGLANSLPINGIQTGEVSRKFETLFTPTGFTFSIWGIIYVGLLFFGFYGCKFYRKATISIVYKLKQSILTANILNISWILLWHHILIGPSVMVMLLLLFNLLFINLTIHTFRHKVKNKSQYFWFVRLPYGIYLGWILVATIANISIYLTYIQWSGFGLLPQFWLAVVLITGCAISLFMFLKYRIIGLSIAVIWGYFGVAYNLQFKGEDQILIFLTYALSILIFSVTIFKLFFFKPNRDR